MRRLAALRRCILSPRPPPRPFPATVIPEHVVIGRLSGGSEIPQIGSIGVFDDPNQLGQAKGKE
eukprot:5910189-Pyramimonas_sp.AAC.2